MQQQVVFFNYLLNSKAKIILGYIASVLTTGEKAFTEQGKKARRENVTGGI